ncbi:DUF6368 family protein [Streptomyces sp. NPDC014846]|uniref:DUF6368 family protein n=1 Tax=unclassified Streptomyces TaxID=2593676 RepID=UPI0036FD00B1
MSGPTLVIDLAGPPSPTALRDFPALMAGLSSRLDERRPGFFDVSVPVERLGIEVRREEDRRKPFPLPFLGNTTAGLVLTPLVGSDEQRLDSHRPFDVYLMGPGFGDESLFEAEHEDELVANAELLDGQLPIVAGLPGVLGIADDDWMALGAAEFLRVWAGQPAFRLLK